MVSTSELQKTRGTVRAHALTADGRHARYCSLSLDGEDEDGDCVVY